jgi:hypothetical protein
MSWFKSLSEAAASIDKSTSTDAACNELSQRRFLTDLVIFNYVYVAANIWALMV